MRNIEQKIGQDEATEIETPEIKELSQEHPKNPDDPNKKEANLYQEELQRTKDMTELYKARSELAKAIEQEHRNSSTFSLTQRSAKLKIKEDIKKEHQSAWSKLKDWFTKAE